MAPGCRSGVSVRFKHRLLVARGRDIIAIAAEVLPLCNNLFNVGNGDYEFMTNKKTLYCFCSTTSFVLTETFQETVSQEKIFVHKPPFEGILNEGTRIQSNSWNYYPAMFIIGNKTFLLMWNQSEIYPVVSFLRFIKSHDSEIAKVQFVLLEAKHLKR